MFAPSEGNAHSRKRTNVRVKAQAALLTRAVAVGSRLAPYETGGFLVDAFTRAPAAYPRAADVDARLLFADVWSVQVGGRTVRGSTLRPEGRHPIEEGEGPRVLLVHGWGGAGHQLLPFVRPLLARGFEVSFFDLPAHGGSEGTHATLRDIADAIVAVARELGPLHALVAHSVGGAGTILSLIEGCLEVDHVVLVAPPSSLEEQASGFAHAMGASDAARHAMLATLHGILGRPIDRASWLEAVSELRVPLLVVHDRRDRVTPFEGSKALVESWPGSELLATDGLGHGRILGEPSVVDAVVRFVSAGSRARPSRARPAAA